MAISATMTGTGEEQTNDIAVNTSSYNINGKAVVVGAGVDVATEAHDDGHENDVVMPGFRFHPTEEELIEFYLRRKVEGKRFNVDLITFLDLYRYDPWELPALAMIGEKEWFFYVPRDRKYRNGDRPNRVTTSGYWKATGADRTIRSDQNSRSIGLKKTLVFYSGKAPKGIRTAWIMNEYRLTHTETDRYNKAEISLCRVYKRASDHSHLLPATLSSKPSSSKLPIPNRHKHNTLTGDSTTEEIHGTSRVVHNSTGSTSVGMSSVVYNASTVNPITNTVGAMIMQEDVGSILSNPKAPNDMVSTTLEELNRIVGYNDQSYLSDNHHNNSDNNEQIHILSTLPSTSLQPQLVPMPNSSLPVISDKLWEWSSLPEGGSDFK